MAKKILGQEKPGAAVSFDLYTVPGAKEAVGSTISACNQHASTTEKIRVSVAPAGDPLAVKQYLIYDLPLAPNDTFAMTIGMCLEETDVVRVYSLSGNVSFTLFGDEANA